MAEIFLWKVLDIGAKGHSSCTKLILAERNTISLKQGDELINQSNPNSVKFGGQLQVFILFHILNMAGKWFGE
jgi:hypothetical protein